MKLTVIAQGTHSVEWPQLEVVVNNVSAGIQEIQTHSEIDFDIDLSQEQNHIEIRYVNKKEHHTVVENGEIISDQSVELIQLRLNDILLDDWFITTGHYSPNYFEGFKTLNPNAPDTLKSQMIWHFPGSFIFVPVPNKNNFWFWYRDQRRYIHVKQYNNKDQYREENYVGSLDPLEDLIKEIKHVINIQ
jgi:hypothetical protein